MARSEVKKISYGVSRKRYLQTYCGGGSIRWGEREDLLFMGEELPILISLLGFKEDDQKYLRMNNELANTVFGPLWRAFPLVENVSPSSLYVPLQSSKIIFKKKRE